METANRGRLDNVRGMIADLPEMQRLALLLPVQGDKNQGGNRGHSRRE